MNTNKIKCDLCPRNCELDMGQVGYCKARKNEDGKIKSLSYGKIISIGLDPIEKKPLKYFHPGTQILSVGTFGCNMNCPFCQNHELARAGDGDLRSHDVSPEYLRDLAVGLVGRGNIGIAFTYNEPMINFEYVRDTFELALRDDLETVLVTNGQVTDEYLEKILPLVKALNIDLKTFSREKYKKLGGDLDATLNTIKKSAQNSHVEITTLVVPKISDNLEEFKKEVDFISEIDPSIPLHLTRYFPMYKYEEEMTSLETLEEMKKIAEEKLEHVILGNV
ncbi:AmmeMemoRadiSam system radical SAM enzyme [Peptoniphilus sp.]|jgi:pyruvate formate lyase activating enzyme|uniref:AmmeMemoRadiSam system radical SAM enzyme n=1 Tax=Peptoniphilus sp. TaxID=1971214 RepID=UPI003D8F0730